METPLRKAPSRSKIEAEIDAAVEDISETTSGKQGVKMKKPCYKNILSLNRINPILIQRTALWVIVWVIFAGCSVTGTPFPSATAVSEPKGSGEWRIEFRMSGGFAGILRSIELLSTGQMTVIDQKTNKQVTVQVSEMDMEKISSWVIQAQSAQALPRLSDCQDCLEYEITIHRDGELLSFWFNDLTLDNADLAPLINTLAYMQEQALSEHSKP